MKKLFFSVAFMMAASAMFAQTTFSTGNPFYTNFGQWATFVTQVNAPAQSDCVGCDIPQIARVTYNSYDKENMSLVNQTGESNNANVFQTGSQNYSVINQDGDDVFLGTGGTFNDAKVYQSGILNYSDVKQEGDYNDSDVIQSGESNYAKQDVGVGWAEYNKTYVRQFGNENASLQTQRQDGNDARIEQLTNNNEATQSQTSTDSHLAGTGNTASIWQYGGDENKAKQVQTGTTNLAYAEQNGASNVSVENQIGYSNNVTGRSNWSRNLQIGDRNLACVDQKAGPNGGNSQWIYQLGDDNKAVVTQDTNAVGYGNLSYISQYGNLNNACVTQINGTSGF